MRWVLLFVAAVGASAGCQKQSEKDGWQLRPGDKFKTPPDSYLIGKWKDVSERATVPAKIKLEITSESTVIWNGEVGKLDSGHIRIKLPEFEKPRYLKVSYSYVGGKFEEGHFGLVDVTDDPTNQVVKWLFWRY